MTNPITKGTLLVIGGSFLSYGWALFSAGNYLWGSISAAIGIGVLALREYVKIAE